jgi:hypothetical protein
MISPISSVAREIAEVALRSLLPVTIRREGAGRRVRGGTNLK